MFNVEIPEDEIVKRTETKYFKDYVKLSLKDETNKFCIIPKNFVDHYLERINKMEIYEDDIWIVTFPKCGTTWSQEMIWMIGNNLNYEVSQTTLLNDRFPFIESSGIELSYSNDSFELCKNLARPRYIKSHLPLFLLPNQLWTVKPKIFYVARNPKDTAVSWYYHHCNLNDYQGTKTGFIEAFVKDSVLYSPMNDHVIDFWKIREKPNILFLFFEDMKRNLDQEVKKVMKFMDKDYSQDEIDKLCEHLSFESIQNNKMVNKEIYVKIIMEMTDRQYDPQKFSFIRKGKVGGYKEELTQEENEMLDKYAEKVENDFEYKF